MTTRIVERQPFVVLVAIEHVIDYTHFDGDLLVSLDIPGARKLRDALVAANLADNPKENPS